MSPSRVNRDARKDPRTVISIAFRLTVGAISAIGAGALIFAFWMWPSQKDLIVFSAACIGGAAAVSASIYRGKSLELSAIQQRDRLEAGKRLAALRLIEQWNSPTFFHGKKAWRVLMRRIITDKSPDRVQAVRNAFTATDDHDTAESNLSEILNFLEGLALAVRESVVNEQVAMDFFKTIVHRTYEHLEDWIKDRRREVGPRVYQELETLVERWKV